MRPRWKKKTTACRCAAPSSSITYPFGREADDLWELKARLEAAGFWASEVIDHGFIWSLYSFDPNGIAIEFSYPLPDVDVRRRPRLVDPQPSAVTLEGPDPVGHAWPHPDTPIPEEEKRV